jgi:hypothetical protein
LDEVASDVRDVFDGQARNAARSSAGAGADGPRGGADRWPGESR